MKHDYKPITKKKKDLFVLLSNKSLILNLPKDYKIKQVQHQAVTGSQFYVQFSIYRNYLNMTNTTI